MKSSFEELLRDLQIISKELFLSSWNLVSATNLNTAFGKAVLGKAIGKGGLDFGEKRGKAWGAAPPFLQKRSPQERHAFSLSRPLRPRTGG